MISLKNLKISKETQKNFSYLIFAQVTVMLLGLISTSLWTRFVSVEEFGKYQLLLSLFNVVSLFTFSGLRISSQISSAKNIDGNLRLIVKRKLVFSIIGSVALVGIGIYYYFLKSDILLGHLFFFSALIYPFYNLKTTWDSWINGKSEYKILSIIMVVNAGILLLVLTITILIHNKLIFMAMSVIVVTSILNIFILIYFLKKKRNNKTDKEVISYGYKLSGALVIPGVSYFDKFLISEYLSMREVAIFSIAKIFPQKCKILFTVINRLVLPKISAANTIQEAWRYFRPKLPVITLFFAVIGLSGFLFLEYIIQLFFSQRYVNAGSYAKWLWLFIAISTPATYLGEILRAQKILKFSYYFEISTSVGRFLLYLILLPKYGLWGMIISVVLWNVIAGVFFVVYFAVELNKEKLNKKI